MKIAIHKDLNPYSYSRYWMEYCIVNSIPYKMVNAFDSDIIEQLNDCDIFMWHHYQVDPKAYNVAKQILFSLEEAGKIVFPDFRTGWHFDDKLGQKYLFEALGIKAAKAYSFFDKKTAYDWVKKTSYPKVFKLRGGAGSYNVALIKSKNQACRYIRKAFGKGFNSYDSLLRVRHAIRDLFNGSMGIKHLLATMYLYVFPNKTTHLPKQREYIYFQEFIPNDGFDYRVEVCGDKAIALVRYCRKGDFRASGGHNDHFDKDLIPKDVIKFAFEIVDKLKSQSSALDIVRNKETGELFLVENSYCYGIDADEFEHGYWDRDANWHNEAFNGIYWMIEYVINQYKEKYERN